MTNTGALTLPIRFKTYSSSELQDCGQRFIAAAHAVQKAFDGSAKSTDVWTNFVFDWFSEAAPEGMWAHSRARKQNVPDWRTLLDPATPLCAIPERATRAEFLADFVHASCPPRERGKKFLEEVRKGVSIRFALESEWGKEASGSATVLESLWDASKLPLLKADAKALITGSTSPECRGEIAELVALLAERDGSRWLWIDLPWGPDPDGIWRPESKVFAS
jgi:hypothetical protein